MKKIRRIVSITLASCLLVSQMPALPTIAKPAPLAGFSVGETVRSGRAAPAPGTRGQAAEFVAGELIVKMKPGAAASATDAVLREHGGRRKAKLHGVGLYKMAIGAQDPEAAAAAVEADPRVEYAEPNYIVRAQSTVPNDPLYSYLGGLQQIRAADAWDITTGTAGVVVAVSDSGLDFTHPDIDDNVWSSPGETGLDSGGRDKRTNGVDDDGNGYVDDWRGWDFKNGDSNPTDDHGHGTHVAGTVAAEGNNGVGVVGVSWNSKIMPVKFLGNTGVGTMANGAASIIYAADQGAKVINCSWGGPWTQTIEDAVDYARARGAIVIASAGNDGVDVAGTAPAGCANVVCVAATGSNGRKASFSNYGSGVEVSAPGVGILSLQATGTAMGTVVTPGYTKLDGTSMAAPHVSGEAALVFAQHPEWTNTQVMAQIVSSADPLSDARLGAGRINAWSALTNDPKPLLRVEGTTVDDSAANGDGQADAGETLDIGIRLRNIGAPLSEGRASLVTTDALLSIADGSKPCEPLETYESQTVTFTVAVAPAAHKLHKVGMMLSIEPTSGVSCSQPVSLTVSQYVPGFPRNLSAYDDPFGHGMGSPVLADLNGDRTNEVLICKGPYLVALDGRGQALWSKRLGATLGGGYYSDLWDGLAVADIDGDRAPEIVVPDRGWVHILRADGSLYPGSPIALPADTPQPHASLADLDGDGRAEIIVNSTIDHGVIYAYRANGAPVAGWPVNVAAYDGSAVYYDHPFGCAVGDVDGDGLAEVVAGGGSNMLNVFNGDGTQASGWPKQTDTAAGYVNGPALADVDRDGRDEIFATTFFNRTGLGSGLVSGFRGDGTALPGWPKSGAWGEVSIGDLDGDGGLEICTGYRDSSGLGLALYRPDGTPAPGWPRTGFIGTTRYAYFMLADVDGNGDSEIVYRCDDKIEALGVDGRSVEGFGFPVDPMGSDPTYFVPRVALGDIDGDGALDLVTPEPSAGDGNLYAYQLQGEDNTATAPWPQFQADAARTGEYRPLDTSPPSAPASLTATDTPGDRGGAIDLSWAVAADDVGVVGYRIYRGTSPRIYGSPTARPASTTYTDTTAVTGTRYYYAVTALDAAGNESAKSPETSAVALDDGAPAFIGAPVDAGFEGGLDGARLSTVWTPTGSGPFQNYDYDDGDVWPAKTGSRYAYFKGPSSTAYADITAATPISTDDSSITFWYYVDSPENYRYMLGSFWSGATIGTYWMRMDSTGQICAYTSKSGFTGYAKNTYVPIGTMPTGWTQCRITLNFTSDTYTFSTRPDTSSAWTPMKAAASSTYDIPMRGAGNQTSQTTLTFRAGGGTDTNVEFGLDDLTYDIPTLSAAAGTFEEGVDGLPLSTSWVRAGTAFQAADYDDTDVYAAKQGSLYGYLKGPASPSTATADLVTGVPLSTDGSEIRFWANMSSHQNYRFFLGDAGAGAVGGSFWLRAGSDGKLSAYTSVPGNPNGYTTNTYVPIGTLSTGWTEYKLTFNFANDTYTVSTRTDSAAPWTQMKAAGATGYDIPMRGTADNTANSSVSFRVGAGGMELGLDDVRYSATPIVD